MPAAPRRTYPEKMHFVGTYTVSQAKDRRFLFFCSTVADAVDCLAARFPLTEAQRAQVAASLSTGRKLAHKGIFNVQVTPCACNDPQLHVDSTQHNR